MADRPYDVVVLGATGFTGTLTAEYLARNAPEQARWAIAGRNRSKLESLSRRLAGSSQPFGGPPVLAADVSDPASLRAVAEQARVLITTVGPYLRYGEPVVAACAEAGTDYVDLTGEPAFVDLMWLRYHERAQQTGARLVHCCGLESIPFDLGALFTVRQLPEGVPVAVEAFLRANAGLSGGTLETAVNFSSQLRDGARAAKERKEREQRPADRTVRGVRSAPHRDELAGGWVVPMPTVDPQIVLRSARALPRYGPEFTYSQYFVAGSLPVLAGLSAGVGAMVAMAQLPPTRQLLRKLRPAGQGPSEEQREKSWFKLRLIGRAGGLQVITELTGGDPGYGESSKMLAEAGLCLAFDELPETAGQVTPAVAMGDALMGRLAGAGLEFRVTSRV